VIGDDFPAVDATCARIMGVDPQRVDHLRWAGGFLGNIEAARIEQLAEDPQRFRQDFALPPGFEHLQRGPREIEQFLKPVTENPA